MTTGVLCIHGFSGAPYEIKPFAQFIRQQTDWLVEVPTLPGHGEQLHLQGYTHKHWLMAAELAYQRLAKKVDQVIVVGFSMGGVIAMYLARRYKVSKLVLLSAALQYVSAAQLGRDITDMVMLFRHGRLRENELFLRYANKIRNVPIQSTREFVTLVELVKPFYHTIHVPTYIVQGECDGIVPKTTAKLLYETIEASEKYLYLSKNGKHHICYSDDCDVWFHEVLAFLQKSPLSEH